MSRILNLALLAVCAAGPAAAQGGPKLQQADSHFQAQRWSEAERAYLEILKEDSTSAMAWYRLGRIYLEGKRDPARAVVHFQGSLRHKFAPPFFPQFGVARSYVVMGKSDDALKLLDQLAAGGYSFPETVTGDTILARLSGSPRFQPLLATMKRNSEPCEHMPEARQLDFWIGTWDVSAPGGQRLGTNRIEKMLRGCALQENWTDGMGREGKSINFFEAARKTWRQVWVADGNSVLDYTGGEYKDKAMTFTGQTLTPNGDVVLQKLIFRNVAPDTVHQIFEQSTDKGRTWTPTWTGIYVRRK